MPKIFPDELYIIREKDGDDSYFVCSKDEKELADLEEDKNVAVYVLKETGTLRASTEILFKDSNKKQ